LVSRNQAYHYAVRLMPGPSTVTGVPELLQMIKFRVTAQELSG
jgi:hypothetical protein